MKPVVRVAITGAAGQIAYSLLFRIASGEMLGHDQPIILHLLEITPALKMLSGVAMELDDCAYPLLQNIVITDDANIAFKDIDYAILVGAKPRLAGMERSDLLHDNGHIFQYQGRALNTHAKPSVKILVVGNPANTNALIAMNAAPDIDPRHFSSMMRLDHHRSISQLAIKAHCNISDIQKMSVWGNHSSTQYPDLSQATIKGDSANALVTQAWLQDDFIPTVQKRGSAIIDTRGASSAASAAYAALMHMHDWVLGTQPNDWVSMGVCSDGSYGITEGLMYSFPVTIRAGEYQIVQGIDISEFSQKYIDMSKTELENERAEIKALLSNKQ